MLPTPAPGATVADKIENITSMISEMEPGIIAMIELIVAMFHHTAKTNPAILPVHE